MAQEERENIFTLRIPEIGYEGSVSVKVIKKEKIAQITIVNFDNNEGVKAAKVSLEKIFKSLRMNMNMNININVVNTIAGLTKNDLQGINAVYLFGNTLSDTQLKTMNNAIINLHPASEFNLLLPTLSVGFPEYATGWRFDQDDTTKKVIAKPDNRDKERGNFSIISSNSYEHHYENSYEHHKGYTMSKGDFFCIGHSTRNGT